MAAAAGRRHRYDARSDEQHAARMDKITQSHRRFLTMGGSFKARQYTRCPAASFECPMTAEFQVIDLTIPPDLAGQRLDSTLARLMPEHSQPARIKGVDRGRCGHDGPGGVQTAGYRGGGRPGRPCARR